MLERRLAVGLLVPVLAVAAAGRGPDLAVPGVSALPARVSAGELVRVSDTVRNLGTTRAARSRVEYRLVGPAGRTRVLARRAVPALAPGRASRGAARLTVPSGAPAGSYRVLVCVHGAPERNEHNNCGESMPSPRIGTRPADPTAATSARFTFSHPWRGVRFDCRLDAGRPVRCARRVTYSRLAEGRHRFRVTASRGERRATIVHRWTIDTTPPPAPSIDEAPAAASPESSARFVFSDAEPGVRFSCRLEDGPAAPCSNPVEYGGLADGAHRFTVAAADAAGNSGTTTHEWRIRQRPDAETGPVVTLQPTSATVSGTVTPNGRPTSFFVEYGTATSYGLRSATASAGSTPAAVSVQVLLSGLLPATTYHYRVVATTCDGCAAGTSRGADQMLTTPPAGTYQNPVFGGLPDPMGLHDLGDFYTYGTGDLFPVLHSTDLVHWTTVGTAMSSRPAWVPQTGDWNPWAPSVLRREGACPGTTSTACYFMYYTGLNASVSPDANCIGVATSPTPAGPFTDAGILTDAGGSPVGCGDAAGYSNIDPAPFIDPADGQAYLYVSTGHDASGAWRRTVSVIPLAADLVHAAGVRQPLFSMTQPWEGDVVEGPWMTRHGSGYYLLYSGGSFTNASYAMGYALASSPTGPFVKPSSVPILKSTGDVIGPGGGSVVTGPRGDDWLIYHGRAVAGGPRTLRIDPLVWNDAADPPTLTVRGPTTSPQPLPGT